MRRSAVHILVVFALAAASRDATAQSALLGIPDSRAGSGTSWIPDESPMAAWHATAGRWNIMTHGVAFAQYDRQFGLRGAEQSGSLNWFMVGATRPALGGRFGLNGMMSLEPFTIAKKGYPLLLQTGERWGPSALTDYQHPHDLFMELAVTYERLIADSLGVSLYLAPVGEPSAGPAFFGHRPSSDGDPFAPLSHHWQDAAHIQYGVATMGLFTRRWRLEASAFAGDNSDETRTNFDCFGKCFDSWSLRASWNPTPRWSAEVSHARIAERRLVDTGDPGRAPVDVVAAKDDRTTVALMYSRAMSQGRSLAASAVVGVNREVYGGESLTSMLLEGSYAIGTADRVFARVEHVSKEPYDLAVAVVCGDGTSNCAAQQPVPVTSLVAGYLRTLGSYRGIELGLGARGAINFVPKLIEWAYGSTTPKGFAVYLRVRPRLAADPHAGHDMGTP